MPNKNRKENSILERKPFLWLAFHVTLRAGYSPFFWPFLTSGPFLHRAVFFGMRVFEISVFEVTRANCNFLHAIGRQAEGKGLINFC